jgi:hypothetical protein
VKWLIAQVASLVQTLVRMEPQPALATMQSHVASAALARDNRSAAIRRPAGLEWVDIDGGERRQICESRPADFAFDGEGLWVAAGDCIAGYRSGREVVSISWRAQHLLPAADGVVAVGVGGAVHVGWDGEPTKVPDKVAAVAGRGLYASLDGELLVLGDRANGTRATIPISGRRLVGLRPIFCDRLIAMRLATSAGEEVWVTKSSGAVAHRVDVGVVDDWAVAEDKGIALLLTGDTLRSLCLRTGRLLQTAPSPEVGARSIDIDASATGLLVAGDPAARPLSVVHVDLEAALSARPRDPEPTPSGEEPAVPPAAPVVAVESRPFEVPTLCLDGLASTARSSLSARQRRELLDAETRYASAAIGCVIGSRWVSGELAGAGVDRYPGERRVLGLLGAATPDAEALIGPIQDLEHQLELAREERLAARASSGKLTPLEELAGRFDLSAEEAELLVAIAAPSIAPAAKELCDMAGGMSLELLCAIAAVVAPDVDARALFDPGGCFARTPLVQGSADALEVHPAVVSVLQRAFEGGEPVAIERYGIEESSWQRLAAHLEHSREPRFALRGRPGRGRRALVRFLAESAGNAVALIEPGDELDAAIAGARIRGLIPCVVGAGAEHRDRLEASPGPLIACIGDEQSSPLAAGAPVIELGRLDEGGRRALWSELLGCEETALALARRFQLPPELIIELAATTRPELESMSTAIKERFAEGLRGLADRVTNLPDWDEVVLAEELDDSIRELIARHENHAVVAQKWGMSGPLRSSPGLVALFSGPPGTGKTLAAGLIAKQLGRELYRVDVSQVVSKWLGETEKHLGAIFNAAEQANAVLLFDEADSLFAKRSAVKSSNDRYANLEVNYLLQRLDSFGGVAILTTNHGSAIDPAFRRRLTSHLSFHLPDAETRKRLWQAHLPAAGLRSDDIDLDALAEAYPLSGGMIRNIALRAVFLAAADDARLSQQHLDRAIRSEYFERGKLSASGRLE